MTPDSLAPAAPAARVRGALFTARDVDMLRTALRLGNHMAACHVAERCCPVRDADGTRWLDTRAMLDPREHSGADIDLSTEYLAYLEWAEIAHWHPNVPHLVRLTICG